MQTSKYIAMTVQTDLDDYYKGQPRSGVRNLKRSRGFFERVSVFNDQSEEF